MISVSRKSLEIRELRELKKKSGKLQRWKHGDRWYRNRRADSNKLVEVQAPGANTGKNVQVHDGLDGSQANESEDVKNSLANKCTMKFHSGVDSDTISQWYIQDRQHFPSPENGLQDSNVVIFWDIENCPPSEGYAPLPLHYAEMLRNAFKTRSQAYHFMCVASLSKTYQGKGNLSYDKLNADLNAHANYMYILTAPGKKSVLHKDVREADHQLKSKMDHFLSQCRPGDLAVIISGDQGFTPFCMQAKEQGVNVIVMGNSLSKTSGNLMAAADMFMSWPTFAKFHGKKLSSTPEPTGISSKVHERTTQLQQSHVEQFSCVKQMDFICLMDISGSMGTCVKAVKESVTKVLDEVETRFPWAKKYMRMSFVGYRDFMKSWRDQKGLDPDPYVWPGYPGPPKLGALADAEGSADRLKAFLDNLKVSGGADDAEDVLGGLLKVAEMLENDGMGRNCILFHICEEANHGREFNDHTAASGDSYPDGPLNPAPGSSAIPPPGRTKPWVQEAQEVLNKLKNKLNVAKYVIVQVEPNKTAKMIAKFKDLVGDPVDEKQWSWKSKQQPSDEDPWITGLELSRIDVKEMTDNLVGMMVSTTLATVGRLSQLVHDTKRGLAKKKKVKSGENKMLQTLAEVDEEPVDEVPETTQSVVDSVNAGAADPGPIKHDSGSSTAYTEAMLNQKKRIFIRKLKEKLRSEIIDKSNGLREVKFEPPAHMGELIDMIREAARAEHLGKPVPTLLFERPTKEPITYYKDLKLLGEGAQRLAYTALREMSNGPRKPAAYLPMALKEFSLSYQGGHSLQRYKQLCHGNVVASFLASEFNAECEAMKITEVNGKPRPVLQYLEMWVASWKETWKDGSKKPINHHAEPYILGKYIKYTSNSGAVNMSTLNDICHAFSHWTYEITEHLLLVSDVQGVDHYHGVKDHQSRQILLTDPAIHCVPLVEAYFDPSSNRGPIGVKEFFSTHRCNEICCRLGLKSAEEELAALRADAKEGKLPGRNGAPVDLDKGL